METLEYFKQKLLKSANRRFILWRALVDIISTESDLVYKQMFPS